MKTPEKRKRRTAEEIRAEEAAAARRAQYVESTAKYRQKLKAEGARVRLTLAPISAEAAAALKAQPGGATAAVEALGMRLHRWHNMGNVEYKSARPDPKPEDAK